MGRGRAGPFSIVNHRRQTGRTGPAVPFVASLITPGGHGRKFRRSHTEVGNGPRSAAHRGARGKERMPPARGRDRPPAPRSIGSGPFLHESQRALGLSSMPGRAPQPARQRTGRARAVQTTQTRNPFGITGRGGAAREAGHVDARARREVNRSCGKSFDMARAAQKNPRPGAAARCNGRSRARVPVVRWSAPAGCRSGAASAIGLAGVGDPLRPPS